MSPNEFRDTAAQRPATGLNAEARELVIRVAIASPRSIVSLFFEDLYASYDDYFAAVEVVWGSGSAAECRASVSRYTEAGNSREGPLTSSDWLTADYAALGLLRVMPEPDFRAAMHNVFAVLPPPKCEERVTGICKGRGAPWRYTRARGFEWIGDESVAASAVVPAVSAVQDPRFLLGVKVEFDTARAALGLGTPPELSRSVHQSGCAVESAMKVVLDDRGVAYDAIRDTAQKLFEHLRDHGVVLSEMERVVLGPATPRNRWAGHGAGAVAHSVSPAEAAACFGSACVAIAYLHSLLP